jgi:hypothetical protein
MLRAIILATTMMVFLVACQLPSLTSYFFEVSSGSVLFQDDFSDTSSGWGNLSHENFGILDYFDGYFRIQVEGDRHMLWTGPGLDFSDIRLEADSIKVIGSPDDIFGLVCRAADQENFYFFAISSDGYYGIGKMINGEQELISMSGMLPNEVISQGKAVNHLRADCTEDHLVFFVNGQMLASVNDLEFTTGDVGLFAGTLEASENVVLFDNFSVLNP